ncbi:Protein CSN12 [Sphaceloma murrayae]|uniref:Protein CSN12 n=1 Tax=Sphaceloma murrayae TaxID=2082308 RepID=A0A2K1R2V0_9PEZI|nr:Protein CSN12 [Sphaceloma murrayae]
MDRILTPFRAGLEAENGYELAASLSPTSPPSDPGRLYAISRALNAYTAQSELRTSLRPILPSQDEREVWTDIFTAYHKSLLTILSCEEVSTTHAQNPSSPAPDWSKSYATWKDLLNALHRGYTLGHLEPWTLPLLYQTTKHLRVLALRADATQPPVQPSTLSDLPTDMAPSPNLEDCARQTNRIFALVTQDRSPAPNRKYGTYFIAVLLFKTYFRLNSISLCKNIVRSINASAGDMPPLELFPKSHRVMYRYYVGVVSFLEERYAEAEEALEEAYALCLVGEAGARQAERVLTYLVPTKMLTRHVLPSGELLARHGRLEGLFGPLCRAVRRGDLRGFDAALAEGEEEFVKMRVYLTLERGRDVAARNLLRKVYLAAGWEQGKEGEVRRSRIAVAEWAAGLRCVGEDVEGDEVEGLIAGLIYKASRGSPLDGCITDTIQNLIKGYISRAHGMVVLNKKGAFPGTGV